MTLLKDLIDLGFKENDAAVYMAVLEHGEPGIGDIEKETGLHRQLIYLSAQRLEKQGLLSIHQIRGRRHFSVTNPAALEEQAHSRLKQTQELIPHLLEHASKKRAADDVRVYRGLTGVRHYYREVLRSLPNHSHVRILGTDSERYFKIMPKEGTDFSNLEDVRTKKNIQWQVLVISEQENLEANLNQNRKGLEMKIINDPVSATNDIMIWHDRVGLLFFTDEPYVLDLAGEQVVKGFSEYFDVLWKRGKTVKM
jgi:sugar-specific transcriptional regulator TrmB